tara:strand:+ start:27487 stop:28458 length:972 start_codon:yes stop_codon:yes gene_type:complete
MIFFQEIIKNLYILVVDYIHNFIYNKQNTTVSILDTKEIRTIGEKKMNISYFKNKMDAIRNYYNKEVTSSSIFETNVPYSKNVLKLLSNNYTQPVLFTNPTISVEKFDLFDTVQINDNNIITTVKKNEKKETTTIFNQKVLSKYFTNLNNIFKHEKLYYDYFDTAINYTCGIHNEMNSTINFQLEGEKEWLLIDPLYSDYLVPFTVNKDKNVFLSLTNGWNKLPNKICAPHIKVIVKPGQLLFVPSWWWHQPTSLTRSRHLSIRTVHNTTFNHKLFMPEIIYKFAFLLPYFYKNEKQTNNMDLNSGMNIINYYKNEEINLSPL